MTYPFGVDDRVEFDLPSHPTADSEPRTGIVLGIALDIPFHEKMYIVLVDRPIAEVKAVLVPSNCMWRI